MSNCINTGPLTFSCQDIDIPALRKAIEENEKKGKYNFDFDKPDLQHYVVYWFIGPKEIEEDEDGITIRLDSPRRSALTWRDVRQVIRGLLAPYRKVDFTCRLYAFDLDWDGGQQEFYEDIPFLPLG